MASINPYTEDKEDFCLFTMHLWLCKSNSVWLYNISTSTLVLTLQSACTDTSCIACWALDFLVLTLQSTCTDTANGCMACRSRLVLTLQSTCTDTTKYLYWHYKPLVVRLQACLYPHYEQFFTNTLTIKRRCTTSIPKAILFVYRLLPIWFADRLNARSKSNFLWL